MKLTNIQCKTAKPKEKPYKLTDGQGLYLDVRPNGSKYWRLKYRFAGKEKLLAIGVYPEISLAEARDKRFDARKLLAEHKDPSLEKKRAKLMAQISAENTFEAIAREWLENKKHSISPKHAQTTLSRMERDLFPYLGVYPITEINPPMLLEVIRKIEKRGAFEVAQRTLQTSGQIFRYAIATGRAERDMAADLKGALAERTKNHYASIEVKELPELWNAICENKARLYPQTILATKLLFYTFVRTSELIEARWGEFDLENAEWIIPAERMKMKKSHIVPLSQQALDILYELKEQNEKWDWILPSQVSPRKHMSNGTVLGVFRRLGYKGRMTGHGCRALAMTAIKEKLGYRHEVVDRQLAHAHRNKVNAAYDRAQFLDERRKMMQDWADYIDEVSK